jgi:hypothetical protein
MSKTVVILGAGFSRAISKSMPLLSDLAPRVLEELNMDPDTIKPFGDNLEQWMSFLSMDQPWLSESDNIRNRAQFMEASKSVNNCIRISETDAIGVGNLPPSWLVRLVLDWCHKRAAVISFNYDLLVERTVGSLNLAKTSADFYGISLDKRYPSGGLPMLGSERPSKTLLTLHKLHGSVNWHYGGLDAPVTDRVVLTDDRLMWKTPFADREALLGREAALHDDVVPLIIPPTGAKGGFYSNKSLRAQWSRAHNLMCAAQTVAIIGYSFPETDLAIRHFLATANPNCDLTIVNLSPSCESTVRSLVPDANVRTYFGDRAVENFVDEICGDFVRWGYRHVDRVLHPFLEINLKEEPLPDGEDRTRLSRENDNGGMQQWIHQIVEERWPRLTETATAIPWSPLAGPDEKSIAAYDGWVG